MIDFLTLAAGNPTRKLIAAGVILFLLIVSGVLIKLFGHHRKALMLTSFVVGMVGVACFGIVGNYFPPPEGKEMFESTNDYVLVVSGLIGLIGLLTAGSLYGIEKKAEQA